MHISYDEFEKVMIAAFDVFTTWDDEYEKLQVGSAYLNDFDTQRTVVLKIGF